MNAHNLQIQIQAMAIMVRVDGMKADNAIRFNKGENFAYDESDFEYQADQLDNLMREVSHE